MSQRRLSVGSSRNGSITAVSSSGIRIMSDSLMDFQPEMEEPSNITPSAKESASMRCAGRVVCCSFPRGSVKRISTHFTSLSLIICNVLSDIFPSIDSSLSHTTLQIKPDAGSPTDGQTQTKATNMPNRGQPIKPSGAQKRIGVWTPPAVRILNPVQANGYANLRA